MAMSPPEPRKKTSFLASPVVSAAANYWNVKRGGSGTHVGVGFVRRRRGRHDDVLVARLRSGEKRRATRGSGGTASLCVPRLLERWVRLTCGSHALWGALTVLPVQGMS
uniref:Uncharacterized protein n=1 Tax=Leersia perrieri TaxID=77586 RepID=A0A0D9XJ04_9ORYZ